MGRSAGVASFDTPKSVGEFVGRVAACDVRGFTLDRDAALAAGDGICIGADGTNVNSVEGRRIAPNRMPASIRPGAAVYRCITSAMESRVLETTANILTALKLAGAIGIGSVIILVLPQAWFSFFPRLKRKNS